MLPPWTARGTIPYITQRSLLRQNWDSIEPLDASSMCRISAIH